MADSKDKSAAAAAQAPANGQRKVVALYCLTFGGSDGKHQEVKAGTVLMLDGALADEFKTKGAIREGTADDALD